MGSEGRRSAAYRKTSALFKTGQFPCHFGCGRPGTTVDHEPPLRDFPNPNDWQGQWLPACRRCQCAQGGRLRTRTQQTEWVW